MREAVQRIYRERKALVASVKDTSSALAKLDAVLLGVAFIIIIFLCLLIFNRANTLSSLVPLATIILGFSFIFGHSAQVLFESVRPTRFALNTHAVRGIHNDQPSSSSLFSPHMCLMLEIW